MLLLLLLWILIIISLSVAIFGGGDDDDDDGGDGTTRRFFEEDDNDGDEELDEAVWDGTDRHIAGIHSQGPDIRPRLSRDLEEGFRDSSDEEEEDIRVTR